MTEGIEPPFDSLPAWAVGYWAVRPLDDDVHWLALMPLTSGRARVAVCTPGGPGEHWCYPDPADAVSCFGTYPDITPGWSRHMHPDGRMEYPADG